MTRLQGLTDTGDSHPGSPGNDGRADPSFEERWAQWQAKGLLREARLHRQLMAVAVAVGVGAAALLTWVVALG